MSTEKACPTSHLRQLAGQRGLDVLSRDFARHLDETDPLAAFRDRFAIPPRRPQGVGGPEECVYLCGNSLGLKPRSVDAMVAEQLGKWATQGVEMHFEEPVPAALCDREGRASLGRLVGAAPSSVVLMNALTVNLHLLLTAFYRPRGARAKILVEGGAFPSDRYALKSQLSLHGIPDSALIQLLPRDGEDTLRTGDILQTLEKEGEEIAVVCLSGVQYYTGQKFDMEEITRVGRSKGCIVGWDLAHAIGNVEIKLDEWGVDFACWCTYKYLNAGAGCIAGAYVNARHEDTKREGQLHGWWSNTEETRFQMKEECDVAPGVDGFRLSNPSPFLVVCVLASLEIFDEARMDRLLAKQRLLTGYLELLLREHFMSEATRSVCKLLTPSDESERGCQLSVSFTCSLVDVHREITKRGVMCDTRQPNVMRLAPVPLYNSFADVHRFIDIMNQVFDSMKPEDLPLKPVKNGSS